MRKLLLAGGAVLVAGAVGCEALLGSFEVAPGDVTFEAGAEGGPLPGEDGGGPTPDAAPDGPVVPPQMLKCVLGPERLIEQDPALPFDRSLEIHHVGNRVRIVARKVGQPGPTIYSLDAKGAGPLAKLIDLANVGDLLDVRRNVLQSSLSVFVYEAMPTTGVARFVVYEVPDLDASRPVRIPVSADLKLQPVVTTENVKSGALDLYAAQNEYFWAASVPSIERPGTGQAVVIGHASKAKPLPYPVTIQEGPLNGAPGVRDLFRSGQYVYVFDDRGPQPTSAVGGSYFQVPETPPDGVQFLPVPSRSLTPAGSKPLALMAAGNLTPPLGGRLVTAELDFSGQGDLARILAGEVSDAQLTAPTGPDASKLPLAFSLPTINDVPASGDIRLTGPDFIWLGTVQSPSPNAPPPTGLNFVWFDLKTRTMRARHLGADRLLPARGRLVTASATLAGASTPLLAELDVAWVAANDSGNGLYYAPMTCAP